MEAMAVATAGQQVTPAAKPKRIRRVSPKGNVNQGGDLLGANPFLFTMNHHMRTRFVEYFSDDLQPNEALVMHQLWLLADEATNKQLGSCFTNPTIESVFRLYYLWKNGQLDKPPNVFPFQQMIEVYGTLGIKIGTNEESPFVVVIATELMQRAQRLRCSSEMIFVDASSKSTAASCCITVFYTATKSGAVPITVIVHENQSEDCYSKAFNIVMKNCPCMFGGQNAPVCFITGDSSTLKNAISARWPKSQQYFSVKALLHSLVKILSVPESGLHRFTVKLLMKKFTEIMMAPTLEAALILYEESQKSDVRVFAQYIAYLYSHKQEWLWLYRQADFLFPHKEAIYSYSEASISCTKELILSRVEQLSVRGVTSFVIICLDKFYASRLLHFSRHPEIHVRGMCQTMWETIPALALGSFNRLDTLLYQVYDRNKRVYVSDLEFLYCSCFVGSQGGFCVHLASLCKTLNVPTLLRVPAMSSSDRHILKKLAEGDALCAKKA